MNPEKQKMAKRWKKCWHVAPDIYQILKESKSLDSARHKMLNYLNSTEAAFRNDYFELSNADFILFKHALIVLKNILARRYERISQSSSLEYLWKASRDGDADVEDGFIDEFEHLFRAVKGHSTVYPSDLVEGTFAPDFEKYTGREAAVKRSDFLDDIGEAIDQFIDRFPSGLHPETMARRKESRKRVLAAFGADESDWQDYRWHFSHVIKNRAGIDILKKVVRLTAEEEEGIELAINSNIPFGITPHYLHLMDEEPSSFDYAIRRQVFPSATYGTAMNSHKDDRELHFDFMREHDTSPVDHLTRRYPKVAIIKPYDTCAQICVYCQRNWEITSPFGKGAAVSSRELDRAVRWIARHKQIMDILVTGGDPLVMPVKTLERLLSGLAAIDHLRNIRIASRIPVVVPQRLNQAVMGLLEKYNDPPRRNICLVTHFSHPYEISQECSSVVRQIRRSGISVYNQQVFTFANSRRFESVALRIALKTIGIDPYYMFNMKGKSEMVEYAVPVARIIQEASEEARLLPGVYRSDEPVFNVPFLGKNYMRAWQNHELISILPSGRRVYAFHPWEKNLRKTDSYIYTDVSIRDYLNRLQDRGEDIDPYRSIWYYY